MPPRLQHVTHCPVYCTHPPYLHAAACLVYTAEVDKPAYTEGPPFGRFSVSWIRGLHPPIPPVAPGPGQMEFAPIRGLDCD